MNWLRFEYPILLHLLWGVPLLIALYLYAFRQKKIAFQRFSHHLTASVHFGRQKIGTALMILGYLFLVLALAHPQVGTKSEPSQRPGLDIMVAVDISASMLAEDIKPNRLLTAKRAIASLINRLRGERIGLIAFAGSGTVQCPLTTDYATVRGFLDVLQPSTVSQSGTQIGEAVRTAVTGFSSESDGHVEGFTPSEALNRSVKVLVVFSDGEDHGEGAINAAESASERRIRIFCVGVGSPAGAPIPIREGQGQLVGYKQYQGEMVATRLDDSRLRTIAQLTDGGYYNVTEMDALFKALFTLETRAFEARQFTQYENRFQYFLALALLCLVLELLLTKREKTGREGRMEGWKG
jgi:Ca-activated chloride channel family protein